MDAICEMKPSTEDESFLYLDPNNQSEWRRAPTAVAFPRDRDQYTNFVSLEPSLLLLNLLESYRAYNDPKVADTQIEQRSSRGFSPCLIPLEACQ
ncbi:hypothetical protein PF004_g11537 [Phytophthora fragariae]|uniref:Uncharacterized protein n=1 Tax=Phytophthora fragariae TaxID=53985 RepID=A0A6G0NXR6_9STRA|nr:hypothetical protein PF004_g11537 [Phytophthora fragariae]